MKTSSDFTVDEIGKLITIANLLGIQLPVDKSGSVDFYLTAIIEQLKHIPYIGFGAAIHCVDVAILRNNEILLGRKEDELKYRFIGGFANPGESSHETAKRELKEETGIDISIDKLKYLSSHFIDDERFKSGPHKLISTLFHVIIDDTYEAVANDDIKSVWWFPISDLKSHPELIVIPEHQELLKMVIEKFNHE